MKKEIDITFEKDKNNSTKALFKFDVLLNGEYVDTCTIYEDTKHHNVDDSLNTILCLFFGVSYLHEIEQLKTMHNEHFKNDVDLFGFAIPGAECFFINSYGSVENKIVEKCDWNHYHEKHFNRFPTKKLAEKARSMSLDERKQYLFAIAKGYDVLTREEITKTPKIDLFDYPYLSMDVDGSYGVYHSVRMSNIRFVNSKHAKECADFMNETKEVSE